MIYLNEKNILDIGINWEDTIETINNSIVCLKDEDFSQPIKPYLRYRNKKNRIIAMPAFLGGKFNIAGIKWIASFPDNLLKNIPRAHSVIILNDADTGEPVGIVNTALLSIIRTASVSGLIIKYANKIRKKNNVKLGIVGFGPIGQHHLKMCQKIMDGSISDVLIYDIKPIDNSIKKDLSSNVIFVNSWEEAYLESDIFITCTVSKSPYINKPPKKGSLHLNVSLRDYETSTYEYFKNSIIVDNWEEVCRESTDIENMHLEKGLKEENTKSIIDVIGNCIETYPLDQPILFNPMGMGVFDIAIGKYYLEKSEELNIGDRL